MCDQVNLVTELWCQGLVGEELPRSYMVQAVWIPLTFTVRNSDVSC
ncbi:hypothetical protein VCR20J5_770002 [Vibrio crassostreae]|nr:hypothetical protein [Vibrio crassostreae]CDT59146.1 hypothetical protein VCR19J5_620002 [Vibrio crassostreae]CDT71182.1 hypothetical protein VCR20J5_770002 [Vibrio crassostreae]